MGIRDPQAIKTPKSHLSCSSSLGESQPYVLCTMDLCHTPQCSHCVAQPGSQDAGALRLCHVCIGPIHPKDLCFAH